MEAARLDARLDVKGLEGATPRDRMRSQKTKAPSILHAERRARAVAYRLKGFSYRKIGERMRGLPIEERERLGIGEKYGETSSYRDVVAELERLQTKTSEDAEKVRIIELSRIDAMISGVWDRAEGGNVEAIETVIKLQARRARYVKGLEVPTRNEVTGADGEPIEVIDARESLERKLARLAADSAACGLPAEPEPRGTEDPGV